MFRDVPRTLSTVDAWFRFPDGHITFSIDSLNLETLEDVIGVLEGDLQSAVVEQRQRRTLALATREAQDRPRRRAEARAPRLARPTGRRAHARARRTDRK